MLFHCALLLLAVSSSIASPLPNADESAPELPIKDCGTKYGCLALPNATCLSSHNGADCHTLVTYQRNTKKPHSYHFQLYQRQPLHATDGFWMALGFSIKNNLMPNTTIVECRYMPNGWPSRMTIQTAHAGVNATLPPLVKIPAVHPTGMSYWDGHMLTCSFLVDRMVKVKGERTVDLKKPIYLLTAQGLIDNDVLQHHQSQGSTNHTVRVGHYPVHDSETKWFL